MDGLRHNPTLWYRIICLFLVYIRDSKLQNIGSFSGVTDVHDFRTKREERVRNGVAILGA